MASRGNNFDSGANGATFTASNSNTSGDAFQFVSSNGTFVYTTSNPAHGAGALRITPVASSPSGVTYGSSSAPLASTAFAARQVIRFDSLPTESNPIISVTSDGSTRCASIGLEQTGKVQIRDSSTVLSTSASPNLVSPNSYYTFELWGTIGATANFHGRVYAGDNYSSTIANFDTTSANTGTNSVQTIVFGKFLSTAWATPFQIDDVAIDTAATGYIGPYGAPTTNVTATVTPAIGTVNTARTLTLTINNGNGNAVTWGPVNWGDGLASDPAVTTAAGITSKTFTRTPTVAGTNKSGTFSWSQA